MVSGIQLDYKLKQGKSAIFNQKMFGRISTRRKDGNIYAYYIPGVLDDIEYCKIHDGRIFIATSHKVDFDPIMGYCESFNISSVSKPTEDVLMRCGRDRWIFIARERGLHVC